MLVFFNECKGKNRLYNLNNALREPLWSNNKIVFKNKPIFFKTWLKSGLKFVNDIVDENGIKPIEWFADKLICKNNWICEYNIVKIAIEKLLQPFKVKNIIYENIHIKDNPYFILQNHRIVNIKDFSSKLFYDILRDGKFIPPLHQHFYHRIFNITKQSWSTIYKQKICNIFDTHIADFNYKLLNNLTSNKVMLKKWKISETDKCTLCNEREDNEHLILRCKNVSEIWRISEFREKLLFLGSFGKLMRKLYI